MPLPSATAFTVMATACSSYNASPSGLCTKNTSRALIERPYSCAPQAVGAVYDRPGFFVQSRAALFAQTDSGIKGVVARNARPELVQEGFRFTEGPVGTADGGLYFSDIMGADKTYRLEPGGKISVYRSGTNGMNGLALMRDGSLIGAEGTGRRISKAGAGGPVTLTEGISGMRLMAPNDLIVEAKGG